MISLTKQCNNDQTSSGKCYAINIMYRNNYFLTRQIIITLNRVIIICVKTDDRNVVISQLFEDLY